MKNHWLDKKKERAAEEAFGKFVTGCDPSVITGDVTIYYNIPEQISVTIPCQKVEWTYTVTS